MQRAPFVPLSAYCSFVPPHLLSPPQLAGFHWPLSNMLEPQVCIITSCKVPVCMKLLANPPITVTRKVFFLVFVSVMFACQVWASLYFVYGFPFFLSVPFDKPTPSDNPAGINIPTFHIPLPISVVDEAWVSPPPPLLPFRFSSLFVLVYGFLLFLSIFAWKRPLSRYSERNRCSLLPQTLASSWANKAMLLGMTTLVASLGVSFF